MRAAAEPTVAPSIRCPRTAARTAARTTTRPPLDALALAAREGDARAMEQLLGKLTARVRPLVRHKVSLLGAGVLSIDDAEDVVQEVVLAAWRFDVPRFRPELGSFSTFLSRRLAWHVRSTDLVAGAGRRLEVEALGLAAARRLELVDLVELLDATLHLRGVRRSRLEARDELVLLLEHRLLTIDCACASRSRMRRCSS